MDVSCVRSYKYFGIIVTLSGEIKSEREDVRVRALRALVKIKFTPEKVSIPPLLSKEFLTRHILPQNVLNPYPNAPSVTVDRYILVPPLLLRRRHPPFWVKKLKYIKS